MCYETESAENAILAWCTDHEIECDYIAPGKPMQNGYVEACSRMRGELWNETLFGLDHALIGKWRGIKTLPPPLLKWIPHPASYAE